MNKLATASINHYLAAAETAGRLARLYAGGNMRAKAAEWAWFEQKYLAAAISWASR